MKKVLVTAGSTRVMIDQVRCISNIFGGRTGSEIARTFFYSDLDVTLLTSNPNYFGSDDIVHGIRILKFKTYDELYSLMETEITTGNYDVIIHSAAVSDYKVEGTYWIADELNDTDTIVNSDGGINRQVVGGRIDASTKISSSNDELFLRLVPTEKIVDKIRDAWGFEGTLVKFKLQVGISDQELIDIAYKSMLHSKADMIVANCLEWSADRAFIISTGEFKNMEVEEVEREKLPSVLYNRIYK